MSWYGGWRPYVPVAQRRARAAGYAAKLAKKENRTLSPVRITGRTIAHSFWGQAWCQNLEQYSDFANRLPRGRSYARNGSIIDLQIKTGKIEAIVSGSEIYRITIEIETLLASAWKQIKQDCSQSIDSLIDLLQGRLSQGVMARLTQPKGGLFPKPAEIEIKCSCPDWAYLCKHAAAVLYGVGARLDTGPELLFTLRKVDHLELLSQAVAAESLERTVSTDATLATADLGEMFGIDLEAGNSPAPDESARTARSAPAEAQALPGDDSRLATRPRGQSRTKAAKKTKKTTKKEPPAGRPLRSKLTALASSPDGQQARKPAKRKTLAAR